MTFDGAVIKEQGVTFGIMVVKPQVLKGSQRDALVRTASGVFGGIPTILMAQGQRTEYYGRSDLVKFMSSVPISRVPWKRYRSAS